MEQVELTDLKKEQYAYMNETGNNYTTIQMIYVLQLDVPDFSPFICTLWYYLFEIKHLHFRAWYLSGFILKSCEWDTYIQLYNDITRLNSRLWSSTSTVILVCPYISGLNLALEDMYSLVGHQGSDFIYRYIASTYY